MKHGDRHGAGRALVKRALAFRREGRPQEAINLVGSALELIDPRVDPGLALSAVHNLLWFQASCGRFEVARAGLAAAGELYRVHGGALYDLRVLWLEGWIAAGLGESARAEELLRKARQEFLARDLHYTAAMVALDLGVLLLEGGRTAEARALIEETVTTFRVLNIPREVASSLLLLGEAARQDRLTVKILKSVAASLQEHER
jgi:tetratricopeptide (TPR) repeat protein